MLTKDVHPYYQVPNLNFEYCGLVDVRALIFDFCSGSSDWFETQNWMTHSEGSVLLMALGDMWMHGNNVAVKSDITNDSYCKESGRKLTLFGWFGLVERRHVILRRLLSEEAILICKFIRQVFVSIDKVMIQRRVKKVFEVPFGEIDLVYKST